MKAALIILALGASALWAFQKPPRKYPGMEYEEFSVPRSQSCERRF